MIVTQKTLQVPLLTAVFEERFSCVYRITNTANGKCYVGETTDLNHRLGTHRGGSSSRLMCVDFRKHGQESFVVDVLYVFTEYHTPKWVRLLKESEIILELQPAYNINQNINAPHYKEYKRLLNEKIQRAKAYQVQQPFL